MRIFAHKPITVDPSRFDIIDTSPRVIDGVEAYKSICPISKVTGRRESPLKLLNTLANDPDKKRIVDSILQELPAVQSPNVPDADKFELLVHRVEKGTLYQDSSLIREFASIAEPMFRRPEPPQSPEVEKSPAVEPKEDE